MNCGEHGDLNVKPIPHNSCMEIITEDISEDIAEDITLKYSQKIFSIILFGIFSKFTCHGGRV